MSATVKASKPWDWIEQINTSLYELEKRPSFTLATPFQLDLLEQKLRSLLDRPTLKVSFHAKGWVTSEHLWEGVGDPLLPLAISLIPLQPPAYFMTTEYDLKHLMAELFGGEETASFFYDRDLLGGFYHYFTAELLRLLEEMHFASPLVPRIGESVESLKEITRDQPGYVIDFTLSIKEKTFWGRVLLLKEFKEAWQSHFSHLPPPPLSEEMRKKISVDLQLEVGHVELNLEDYQALHKGDFIVLDHCSYDPETEKGGVLLKLQNKPIFRGRFKEEGIKLTNYPIYEEVKEAVDEEIFGPEEENLYGDLEQEPEAGKFPEEEMPAKEEKPLFTAEQLPIYLTVEVGNIRMSAQELMNLTPGKLLELDVSAKEGVNLVVHGKKIGRGELVRVGDTIGVRIISL